MVDTTRKQEVLRWTTNVFGKWKGEERKSMKKDEKGIGHGIFGSKESRLS